jgi:hypothetical protein
MSIIERIKNLWALSEYQLSEAAKLQWDTEKKVVLPERKLATIVNEPDTN